MSNPTLDVAALVDALRTDEGLRYKPYRDTVGKLTIGVGRNLDDVGLSDDEIALMLKNDINRAAASLDQNVPWWRTLPGTKQAVMANLVFNMGWGRLAGFRKFLGAMQRSDWAGAVAELKDSVWWTQVGARGPRTAERLMA